MGARNSTEEPPTYSKAVSGEILDFRLDQKGAARLVDLLGQSHNPANSNIRAQLVYAYRVNKIKEPFFSAEAITTFVNRSQDLVDAHGQLSKCMDSPFKNDCTVLLKFIDDILKLSNPHYFSGGANLAFLNCH